MTKEDIENQIRAIVPGVKFMGDPSSDWFVVVYEGCELRMPENKINELKKLGYSMSESWIATSDLYRITYSLRKSP